MSEAPLISIVDDDALARDGIRELVESLGYKAIAFASAQHFLASRVLAETTCLITDVQMPGLNGLELQEALQSQGAKASPRSGDNRTVSALSSRTPTVWQWLPVFGSSAATAMISRHGFHSQQLRPWHSLPIHW